jgi:hypothetical protein
MSASPIQQDLAAMAARADLKLPAPAPRTASADKPKQRLHPAIRAAADDALAAFGASPEHAALIADLPGLNLHQLVSRLRAALEGAHFAPMMDTIRHAATLDTDDPLLDFIPKAVSLGLLGQAVLLVGLSGSVGYVVDVDLTSPDTGIYAGGAIDVGGDAGIQADVCLGFWREAVDDLGGIYVGEEVDIDDGTGVVEAAFENDDELGLLFVGIGLGIDDGMENTDYYFFEFDTGDAPIYQPGDFNYMVQLQGMNCVNSKNNYDGIYFEFLADSDSTVYRYPAWDSYQMCESHRNANLSNWSVGLIIKFDSSFTLRLHVGDQTMGDATISRSQYSGVNSTFKVTWDTSHVSNGIEYNCTTVLLKA